jgi:hypothetical protein
MPANKAIGAILSQGNLGKDLLVAYASRTLNCHEKNYSLIEKELLGNRLEHLTFQTILISGYKFSIVTDHKPLKWLMNVTKEPTSRLMRMIISKYNYTIVHKAGKSHTNADADALSRITYAEIVLKVSEDATSLMQNHHNQVNQTNQATQKKIL